MKIYTKTGDKGETSLYGGNRIKKNSGLISAIGNLDELNAYIGIIVSQVQAPDIKEILTNLQSDLFTAGSDLATPANVNIKLNIQRLSESDVVALEKQIDEWDKQLSPLKNFILPGGTNTAAMIHYARSLCRRLERALIDLSDINQVLLKYFNRLSDWLFILARIVNMKANQTEAIWKTR